MSDAEGLMWRLDKDPHLSSTFANVSILDRPPDFDTFRRQMEHAAGVVPRLHQVVRPLPGNLGPPTWADDPDFGIDRHVRRVALTEPADDRALLDLATSITAEPFDRTRPLWQFTVVEGLSGGRAALIQKMHHTIADGERGVQLSLEFLDFERDPAARNPTVSTSASTSDHPADQHDRVDAGEIVRDTFVASLRIPLGIAQQVRELLADPARIPGAGAAAAATMRGIVSQLTDVDRARSPLWTERSLDRHLDIASAPFRETKNAALALGGTLNTAFLTIAADAVGRYHSEFGAPVDALRASMAISTRNESSGSNAFSLVRLLVPTAEMPIDERFRAVHEAVEAERDASRGSSIDVLAALASALPTSVVTRLARQQSQTIDFATSNVKGSPVPVYVAGAKLLANHAIGPLGGVAFNLTLLSYLGRLDMGINTDAAAVTDPGVLTRLLGEAVKRLIAAA